MSQPDIPKKVPGYPEWSGIRHILNDFGDDQRIWRHVEYGGEDDHQWLNIDWENLIHEGWSGGEHKILTCAYGIWTGTPISLTTPAGGEMGDHYWRLFMLALDGYREQMFSDPPPPDGTYSIWKQLGYVEYDVFNEEGDLTGTLVPVPQRLVTRRDWAEEDLEDADAAIDAWLERHGYPRIGRR